MLHEEENLIKYAKKASAQNRAKALNFVYPQIVEML